MRPPTAIDTNICYPLQEDPELAEAVDPELRAAAVGQLAARQLVGSPGFTGRASPPGWMAGIGMLVLEGVLALRVGIAGRHSAELVGEGDVLRRPQTSSGRTRS